ncbi:MAG: diacylglycerol kinase family protein [Pseudomonadales bacterium]|nr:diacylglycerol kinase family protein [Pseudomonadales bacterium]
MSKQHRFFKGFFYAGRGIIHGLKNEQNLVFHLIFAVLVIVAGIFFQISKVEWLILVLCFMIVPSLELLNSAIEETCDRLRDDLGLPYKATQWPRDLAAGAVLWSAIGSMVIGLIIFLPHVFEFATALLAQ